MGSRKPEIFTKVAGGTRASGYDSVRASQNSLENRALPRARKPGPYDKIRILSKTTQKIEDPAKMTYSIPDLWSRFGVCVRNLCESFAKVAALMCERKKGKLR